MVVDINKIIIGDRIRKDFGDIKELADDIKGNGLINPPVVNKDFVLLAGERRIRACKSLGWNQIEVRMMDTKDAEHELNIEISENDVRKGFTKSERVDYMKRLLRIEQAKAKERLVDAGKGVENFPQAGKSRDKTAEQFGISGKQMEKEIAIADHKDLLDPSDFADWDEGKLSTNKVYQRLKARLEQTEQELQEALENPEVVQVVPDDYEKLKNKVKWQQTDLRNKDLEYAKVANERNALQERIKELESATQEGINNKNLCENVFYFCTVCNNFIGNVGGLVWLTDKINEMPDREREMFIKAANSFRDWASAFADNLDRGLCIGRNNDI